MGKELQDRSGGVDWRRHYETRFVTPEEVAAKVTSGDCIYVPTQHEAEVLVAALVARAHELKDVEIRKNGGMWPNYGFETRERAAQIRGHVSMAGPTVRDAIEEGIIDFTVKGFGDIFRHIDQKRPGSSSYDFCWLTVTPPNQAGFCCVGAEVWDVKTSMKRAKVNVAGVDRSLPRTFGDTWVHVSEIDYFYEYHETHQVRMRAESSPTAIAIAEHVSRLVRSGDTLEIGAGSTTGALASLGVFDDKEDLGFFSELASPGIIELVKRGVITSKYATVHPNRFVTTGLLGGPEDYAYVDNNPFFEFYDYDYILNPAVIGQNDNMVAINNALSIDLRGQIALVSIGPKIFAGSGGQLSYHLGAYLSKGGRAITVLPSTTSDGKISRIVHQHPQGQMVTIPWDLADTVVTEYGVADLVGKSIRQRAQELIAIAHPDFRPDLQKAVSQLL